MTREHLTEDNPRIQHALDELKGIIQRHYPAATFVVAAGEDPEGVYLKPIVDVEDTEEVFDTVVDRLLQLQIDEELPVYVIPLRPLERVAKMMREQALARPTRPDQPALAP
jgi:hypothetical protein